MTSSQRLLRVSRNLLLAIVLVVAATALPSGRAPVAAQEATLPLTGMVCTTSPDDTFTLTALDGHIAQPDGNVVYMWGFSVEGSPFQHPSPTLCVDEGDTVTITLNNTLAHDVSLIFPGQQNVLADGAPSQPVFDATGELVSLAPVAAANGGSATYSFVAGKPGTFIYQSGTDSAVQVNMGLFGALAVRPAMNVYDDGGNLVEAYAYNDVDSRYNPATEYLLIISEIDPELHMAMEAGYLYDMNDYTPRYWLYNGRGFPDTVADNGVPWLPSQPYGSLIYVHPLDPVANPYPALIRHLNVGTMLYSHHPHGNHGRTIAWDAHVLESEAGDDMSQEQFTVTLAPGQTMDALFAWEDVEQYHPVDNPVPVVIPQLQDLTVGQFYGGSPYLGNVDELPVGMQALNQCGEYYHIAHNHALHQITAWGVVLSGHITFARIDPPLPNECP